MTLLSASPLPAVSFVLWVVCSHSGTTGHWKVLICAGASDVVESTMRTRLLRKAARSTEQVRAGLVSKQPM